MYGKTPGRLRVPELHPCGSLNDLYRVFLMGFPVISRLLCLVHSPHVVDLRVLPCVCTHLLAQMDFTEKLYGYRTSLDMTPFDLQGAFLVHVWLGRSSDLGNRNVWSGQSPILP